MIVLDGSMGEGGGQILRSALALSMVTRKPFAIEKIRANRNKPGLMRGHLTAVEAARAVSGAAVEGAEIGSTKLVFAPKAITPGAYTFKVGTAGSITLVGQTVLFPLMTAKGPSHLVLEGGTHNPFAPPYDFLAESFLPIISRMGPKIAATLHRPGFYPAGGGRMEIHIEPVSSLKRFALTECEAAVAWSAEAVGARIDAKICERELASLKKRVPFIERTEIVMREDSLGPGNVLMVEAASATHTEVFVSFGERGVGADLVAERAANQVKRYVAANVPVGPHLADQLLIPLAMAGGGRFLTVKPTRHTTTNMEVISRFMEVEFIVSPIGSDTVEIEVREK